jgi:hypothetical protein
MKFPVFSQLAGNWPSETSSLVTASSSGESRANLASCLTGVDQRGFPNAGPAGGHQYF